MPRIVVVGALAWDRPIWLDAPLTPAGRLRGRSLGGTLEGRLGGGAANAGAALVTAGHEVAVLGLVSEDGDGPLIMAAAASAGLDVSAVARYPGQRGQTLLLIDPTGERIVLGLDHLERLALNHAGHAALAIATDQVRASRPHALYVRSPLPGVTGLMDAVAGPVVVHWPTSPDVLEKAPILVGSADDLPAEARRDPGAIARRDGALSVHTCIVTQGAGPIIVQSGADPVEIMPLPATVRDTTGAGDIFAAGLIDALCGGAGIHDAVSHACIWGAAAVGLDGSAPSGLASGAFPTFRRDAAAGARRPSQALRPKQ